MAYSKHVFPGGNTSLGFYSYYTYLPPRNPNRIFILKGGPGVGKSSFMKKVANTFTQGFDVEHHHCSSDNDSLDGVVIPKLKVALIDGTAPHIVDPKYPGAVDEIIDLASSWNLEEIVKNKELIIRSTNEVSRLFKRAYDYLKAARHMMDNISAKHSTCIDFDKVSSLTLDIIKEIFADATQHTSGYVRHLFSSAFTPNGYVNYSNCIYQGIDKVYLLSGQEGTGKTTLLKKISSYATDLGYYVEMYHTPLIPDKIQNLIIPDLKVAFTTSYTHNQTYYKKIFLEEFMQQDKLTMFKNELEESHYYYANLLDKALKNIGLAKAEHDSLETYYVPHMDFTMQQDKITQIIERIKTYI